MIKEKPITLNVRAQESVIKYSSRRCNHPGCKKLIKAKILKRNPKADKCFEHYPKMKQARKKLKAAN